MSRTPKLELTPEQKRIVAEIRSQAERDRPQIVAEGRRVLAAEKVAGVHLRNAFQLLQALRKAQGMTLAALAEQTGISKGALSRLENQPESNVTLSTLIRVAEALGHDLQIGVVPRSKAVRRARKVTARH